MDTGDEKPGILKQWPHQEQENLEKQNQWQKKRGKGMEGKGKEGKEKEKGKLEGLQNVSLSLVHFRQRSLRVLNKISVTSSALQYVYQSEQRPRICHPIKNQIIFFINFHKSIDVFPL